MILSAILIWFFLGLIGLWWAASEDMEGFKKALEWPRMIDARIGFPLTQALGIGLTMLMVPFDLPGWILAEIKLYFLMRKARKILKKYEKNNTSNGQ